MADAIELKFAEAAKRALAKARGKPWRPHLSARGAPPAVAPEIDYRGFAWWYALLVDPNGEKRAAERLLKANVPVYLPLYRKFITRRFNRKIWRDCAVVPGMLFVPEAVLGFDDRDVVFDWAQVRDVVRSNEQQWLRIRESEIVKLKRVEADMDREQPHALDIHCKPIVAGARMRLVDPVWADCGEGRVTEVARGGRISVEIPGLFGRLTCCTLPGAEIEVM